MSFLSKSFKNGRGSFMNAIKGQKESDQINGDEDDNVKNETKNESFEEEMNELIIEEIEIDSNDETYYIPRNDVCGSSSSSKGSSRPNDNEKDDDNDDYYNGNDNQENDDSSGDDLFMDAEQPIDEMKQSSIFTFETETFETNPSPTIASSSNHNDMENDHHNDDDDSLGDILNSDDGNNNQSNTSLHVSELFDDNDDEDELEKLMNLVRCSGVGAGGDNDHGVVPNKKDAEEEEMLKDSSSSGEEEKQQQQQQQQDEKENETPVSIKDTTTHKSHSVSSQKSGFLRTEEAQSMVPPSPPHLVSQTNVITNRNIHLFHDSDNNINSENNEDFLPFISEIQINESTEVEENDIKDLIYSKSSPGRSIYKSQIPNYAPISSWIGRLIFNCESRNPGNDDGVTIEIEHAPSDYTHLIGKVIPLRWNLEHNEKIRDFVKLTTRDVKLTDKGRQSLESNEYLKPPSRLHYRFGVGPLESLAGSRVENNVHVILPSEGVTVKPQSHQLPSSFSFHVEEEKDEYLKDAVAAATIHRSNNNNPWPSSSSSSPTTIYLDDHPVQVTGVYYCVVIIIQRLENDLFKVKHYNKTSKKFDGLADTIRIPQAKELRYSKKDTAIPSTNYNIEKSPENRYGWYLYGSFVKDTNGEDRFVVEALEPYRALSLDPVGYIGGGGGGGGGRGRCCSLSSTSNEAKSFIHHSNFRNMKGRYGTVRTTLIDLDSTSQMKDDAVGSWKEGEVSVVIQCIGAMKSDTYSRDGMVVEGHFAYGYATVVLDPITDQLRFDINYIQVYGTTALGVISGAIKRQCFLGCLDTGYIGVCPVSDVLVKLDSITNEYKIGPKYSCSPLHHFKTQLHLMAARYRVGDGLGVVNISRKTSCTQDSNQAFYVALKQAEDSLHKMHKEFKHRCESSWDFATVVMLEEDSTRFTKLKSLCADLRSVLTSFGAGRSDWRQNAESTVLEENHNVVSTVERKSTSILSSNSNMIFPRRAFDEILKMFLRNDAKLWFVTTVVVGGEQNKKVVPLRPVKPLLAFMKR